MRTTTAFFICLASHCVSGSEVKNVSYAPAPQMTRAELWFADTSQDPLAVIVLCPGVNGSGEPLVRSSDWQAFATRNRLGLVGLSFASEFKDLIMDRGYPRVEQGSGNILIDGIRSHYGKDLPIILYGFSSGAHFTEMFVNWMPERVITWCAHATGRYEEHPSKWPVGIVSCGEKDSTRYGAAMTHFKKGRSAGSNLLWISVPESAHEWPTSLHKFVQEYIETVLGEEESPLWVDIDTGAVLSEEEALSQPSLSGWLPSKTLLTQWKAVHQP